MPQKHLPTSNDDDDDDDDALTPRVSMLCDFNENGNRIISAPTMVTISGWNRNGQAGQGQTKPKDLHTKKCSSRSV